MFDSLDKIMNGLTGGGDMAVKHLYTVPQFINLVANIVVLIGVGLSIVSLAMSFVQFITSTGDPKLVEKAEAGILWSGIAFFVCLAAFTLKRILLNFMGIKGIL